MASFSCTPRYGFHSDDIVAPLTTTRVVDFLMNLRDARTFIQGKLERELPSSLAYHNAAHTADVCEAALRLAALEGVEDAESLACLELACWMHDVGFIESPHRHEKRACELVDAWLPDFGVDEGARRLIKELILSTELHSPATTLLEQIIQDADLDYLGREDYTPRAEGLRQELEHRGQRFSDVDWIEFQIHFLSTHRYKTASAQRLRQAGKRAHLDALRDRLQSI